MDLDIPLANSARPYGGGLRVRAEPEQLVGHAETLLQMAGFDRLDIARRNPPAVRRLSVTADLDEMVAMTADEQTVVPAGGELHRLAFRDLQAERLRAQDADQPL
jgi:hypothetical protein